MDYSIEFVGVDVRKDKSTELQAVEGLHLYPINID